MGKWKTNHFKIWMFLLIGLILIPSAFAWDFDNLKNYDKAKEKITIVNALGLGKDLAEYTLTFNTYQCFTDCYAEGTAKLYDNEKLFSQMRFSDGENWKSIKYYRILIEKKEPYTEAIYNTSMTCREEAAVNGSVQSICSTKKVYSHSIERERTHWEGYKGEVLPAGEYRWRLEGQKEGKESVDWIPSAFGKDLDEWAWWNTDWINRVSLNYTGTTAINIPILLRNGSFPTNGVYVGEQIAFTTKTGVQVPRHLASGNNTATSQVWINSTSADYMYYNNPAASDQDDWTNAFGDPTLMVAYLCENEKYATLLNLAEVASNGTFTGIFNDTQILTSKTGKSCGFIANADHIAITESATLNLSLPAQGAGNKGFSFEFDMNSYGHEGGGVWDIIQFNSVTENLGTMQYFADGSAKQIRFQCDGGIGTMITSFDCDKVDCDIVLNRLGNGSTEIWQNNVKRGVQACNNAILSLNPVINDDSNNGFGVMDNIFIRNRSMTIAEINLSYYMKHTNYTYFGGQELTNQAPSVPVLNAPVNRTNITTSAFRLNWSNSTDAEGDAITYGLEIASDVEFTNLVYVNISITERTNATTAYINTLTTEQRYYWRVNATDGNKYSAYSQIWDFYLNLGAPGITLFAPQNTSYNSRNIGVNVSSGAEDLSTWWYSNDSWETNITFIPNTTINNMPIGSNTLYIGVNDTAGLFNWTSVTFYIDLTKPNVTLYHPQNSTYGNKTISVNYSAEDETLNSTRFWVTKNSDGSVEIANTTLTGNTTFNVANDGSYQIWLWVNDSAGNINLTARNFSVESRYILNFTNHTRHPVFEGDKIAFGAIVGVNPLTTSSLTASLVWNNTAYPATLTEAGGNRIFNLTITAPWIESETINKTFYWNFTINAITGVTLYNTTFTYNQTLRKFLLFPCGVANASSPAAVNFTFKDEGTNSYINGTIDSAIFYYFVPTGNTTKTLLFENASIVYNYHFCSFPFDVNLTLNASQIYYSQSTTYPQRLTSDAFAIGNVTREKILYLLSSTTGLYTTFQVLNVANQPITSVDVLAERLVLGNYVEIGSGSTDSAGAITFWVNPNIAHRFTFTKSGYSTYTTTLTPTQTSYTITMESTTASTNVSYVSGISYDILPRDSTLQNRTNYTFILNISSTYYQLQEYGFSISNLSGYVLGRINGSSTTGGIVSLSANTSDYSHVKMDYYWRFNETIVNATHYWSVFSSYKGAASLMVFFDDLRAFSKSGFNDFTRNILAFFIIFMVTGFFSYIQVVNSPLTIGGLIVILTWLMEYGGLIVSNIPGTNVSYFTSIVMTLLFFGYAYYEYSR